MHLPRAGTVRRRDTWHETPADCVVLGFDDRHRRRLRLVGVKGLVFLLDLPDATALRGGDALQLDDGRLVEVVAAPEPLAEVTAKAPATMLRIAWHLGNRHLQVQLSGLKLRMRRDHVIEAMVEGLGGTLREIEAPFDPEPGAYSGATGHDHAHGQSHGHAHAHHHSHG